MGRHCRCQLFDVQKDGFIYFKLPFSEDLMSKKKNDHSGLKTAAGVLFLAGAAIFLERLAKATKETEAIDEGNAYLAQPAPLLSEETKPTLYEKFGKRALDKVLSFCGLVVLAPVFGLIAVAIEIDDPGPVLFKQKRVGKDKHFFEVHKFRSMKMSTPHDVPTHQLADPDQYITRVGRFLRKTSLDEDCYDSAYGINNKESSGITRNQYHHAEYEAEPCTPQRPVQGCSDNDGNQNKGNGKGTEAYKRTQKLKNNNYGRKECHADKGTRADGLLIHSYTSCCRPLSGCGAV